MARLKRPSASRRNLLLLVFHFLLFALALPRSARADDLEKELKFDYLDKTLTLRRFYTGEHLRFAANGSLQGDAEVGPWTVDGQLVVNDIRLRGNRLEIKGRRIYLVYNSQSKQFEDRLMSLQDYKAKDRERLEKVLRKHEVEIEIELPSARLDDKEIASVMNAVFLAPGESMIGIIPAEWRAYFEKQEGKPQIISQPKDPVYFVGSGVSPPRPIRDPEPEYSDAARKLKYQGVTVMYVVVDAAGNPKDIRIITPLGLGLDEKAVAAVSTWKFEPAKKDGQPVAVAVNIEVTFHLY